MEVVQTGNYVLDALIGSKSVIAKNQGILLQIKVKLPEHLYIAEEHLCMVVGNLFDNALEANLKVQEVDKRYIKIDITYRDNALFMYFENVAVGEDRDRQYQWTTTKKQISMDSELRILIGLLRCIMVIVKENRKIKCFIVRFACQMRKSDCLCMKNRILR